MHLRNNITAISIHFAVILLISGLTAASSSPLIIISSLSRVQQQQQQQNQQHTVVGINSISSRITSSALRKMPIVDTSSISRAIAISGGSSSGNSLPQQSEQQQQWSLRRCICRNMLGLWGVLQVVSILANALKRLFPIALQPLVQRDLLPQHWAMYVLWSAYMMYTEGYKAFQLKFSPLVVSRAFSLVDNASVVNVLLAGPYSMGLFGASKRRMIVSWSITAGVFSLVKVVKMLPYPYRSIVDAGVVAGLSYGTASIICLTLRLLLLGKSAAAIDSSSESSNSGAVANSQKPKLS